MLHTKKIIGFLLVFIMSSGISCDPFNTLIEKQSNEDAVIHYQAKSIKTPSTIPDTMRIVTWNIKFGGGRIDFFFDCYGDRVIMTKDEVISNMNGIIEKINSINPDIFSFRKPIYNPNVRHLQIRFK